jgi:hypothetical protein
MVTANKKKSKSSPWLALKEILSDLSQTELISVIGELYALEKTRNKDFLDARFRDSKEVLERYKVYIQIYLAPTEPWKKNQQVSISGAKKVIADYKKATNDEIGVIDLIS